jgi:hypothetical protein
LSLAASAPLSSVCGGIASSMPPPGRQRKGGSPAGQRGQTADWPRSGSRALWQAGGHPPVHRRLRGGRLQRLRRSRDLGSAPLLAASIFLDALNVFLFFLRIFSRDS